MANVIMWHQGDRGIPQYPDCGGGPNFTCPKSKRIAAEYHRSYFTLTGVLNPKYDNDYYGRETWQKKFLEEVKVGDTIWVLLVPPKHTVYDVAAFGETTLADASTLTSLAGMEAELVTAEFAQAEPNKVCAPTNVTTQATLEFPEGADPDEVFVQSKIEFTTTPKQWLGVGLKINKMPKDKENLADIRAKIAVVAHAFGYDAQTHQ